MCGLKLVIVSILIIYNKWIINLLWLFTKARIDLSLWSALLLFSSPTQAVFIGFFNHLSGWFSKLIASQSAWIYSKDIWKSELKPAEISQRSICLLDWQCLNYARTTPKIRHNDMLMPLQETLDVLCKVENNMCTLQYRHRKLDKVVWKILARWISVHCYF